MSGSTFVEDTATSLDAWINEGAQKLHDMLVQAYGNEYVESTTTIATVAGTATYSLPADFYKLLMVELQYDSNRYTTLKPFERAEQNFYRNTPRGWYNAPRYRLSGSKLMLQPTPGEVRNIILTYAPLLQVNSGAKNILVDPSDTVDFPNGWERYVVMYAAKFAMDKEETSSTTIAQDLAKEEQDLKTIIENRDAGLSHSAVDLDLLDIELYWYGQ